LALSVAMLGGCDEQPRDPAELSLIHCRAALGWMSKGIGKVTVEKTQSWLVGDLRHVSILYDMTPENAESEDDGYRDVILCRYLTGNGKKRKQASHFKAQSIQMGGAELSQQQVQTINVTISLVGRRD